MFFKRPGFPEEGELVICTVKKILFHSVFVAIEEYKNLEGMVHISEIAPGRIRNLRDYVREEKQIVCKVLKTDKEKGHIDLSLRRVNPSARSKKVEEYKQEEKAEKIFEQVAKRMNVSLEDVYKNAGDKIVLAYRLLSPCFYEVVVNGDSVLKSIGVPDNYAVSIAEVVKEKISLPEVMVSGFLSVQCFSQDGVVVVREALINALDFAKKNGINAEITYIGAPSYQLRVKSTDYKDAHEKRDRIVDFVVKQMSGKNGSAEFVEKK